MFKKALNRRFFSFSMLSYLIDVLVYISVFEVVLSFMSPTWEAAQRSDIDDFFGLPAIVLLVFSYIISLFIFRISSNTVRNTSVHVIHRAIAQTILTAAVFVGLVAIEFKVVPRRFFLLNFSVSALMLSLVHLVEDQVIRWLRTLDRNTIRVVMVGADENALKLFSELSEGGYGVKGYKVLGFFTSIYRRRIPKGGHFLGKVGKAADYLRNNKVDELYCSLSTDTASEKIDELIEICRERGVVFYYVPNMEGYLNRRLVWSEIGNSTIIKLREEPLDNPLSKFTKRCLDILVSSLFLVLVYPWVWAFVAIGIKISSPGPILFRQKRTGYTGKDFYCLKFRSMKVNVDADRIQATADDPRKTRFGEFLRHSSIDEFPQFFNVLKGDMSIVGPRPHMLAHTDQYSEMISDYMVRHLVKPGITGWAQVSGCRGETKTVDDMRRRVECDIWYIENWSILLDIEIILKTAVQVLKGDKQAF